MPLLPRRYAPARTCQECGADPGGRSAGFCPRCGARVTVAPAEHQASARPGVRGGPLVAATAVVVAVAALAGARLLTPVDPVEPGDPAGAADAEVGDPGAPQETTQDTGEDAPSVAPGASGPPLSCLPAGCERWRIDLEDRWETLGVADDALVLLDRAAVRGGGWGGATDRRDELRVVSLADGRDLVRTAVDLTGINGAPPGGAHGLRLLDAGIVIALDGQVVLVGLDGAVRWAHPIADGVATPVHATDDRLLLDVTPAAPDGGADARTLVLDLDDGQAVWEANDRTLHTVGQDTVVLVEEDRRPAADQDTDPQVTVTGRAVRDGGVRWERRAQGAATPPAGVGLVLLHGAGEDGGDLLVGARDGTAVMDLEREARWLGGTEDGDGVLLLGEGAHGRPPERDGDGARQEEAAEGSATDEAVEVVRVSDAGDLRWRVELGDPAIRIEWLLERGDRLVLLGTDGTTVTLDPVTGALQESNGSDVDERMPDEGRDDAGRQLTREAGSVVIAGDADRVEIRDRGTPIQVAHHDPYLVWNDHELLAVDPVGTD